MFRPIIAVRRPLTTLALLVVTVALAQAVTGRADAAPGTPFLLSGEQLTAGQALRAGGASLIMQTDGNLVSYVGARVIWQSRTFGNGNRLAMQTDGNAVVYPATGRALWASGTTAYPGSQLDLQDDGSVTVFAADGQLIWKNGRQVRPRSATLAPGETLTSRREGDVLTSGSGRFSLLPAGNTLIENEATSARNTAIWRRGGTRDTQSVLAMQTDGNVVLRATDGGVLWTTRTSGAGNRLTIQNDGNLVVLRADGHPIWSSGTTRVVLTPGDGLTSGARLVSVVDAAQPTVVTAMQTDGNLVRYVGGHATWQTGTVGNRGARLAMQSDGNLVVSAADGRPLWSSGTGGCRAFPGFDSAQGVIYAPEVVWREIGGRVGRC